MPASGSPTRRGDEVDEEPPCPLTLEVQLLGVTLDTDHEPPSRMLDRLDQPVVRAGADHEIVAEVAHRLVVHAVHVDAVTTGDGVQTRSHGDVYVVGHLAPRTRRVMVVL